MANHRGSSGKGTAETIRAVWGYLKSLQGALSCLPGGITILDAWANFLGISSAIKPWVYFLVACFVAYVFFSETARYVRKDTDSPEFGKMGKRASIHFTYFVVTSCAYWAGIRYFDMNLPGQPWLENTVLSGFAVLAALSVMEITRALVIQGLRIYISKRRSILRGGPE